MSIIRRLANPRTETRSSAAIPGPMDLARVRRKNRAWTVEGAMAHEGVNACINLLANIATWPTHAFRDDDEGRSIRVKNDPAILQRPSLHKTALEWRREVLVSWLQYGNAAGIVTERDQFLLPKSIELVPMSEISVTAPPRADAAGIGDWRFFVSGQEHRLWNHPDGGDLWWSRGLYTLPGTPLGASPIELAMTAIRLGMAAEDFGVDWFDNGAHPSAILSTKAEVAPEAATKLKQRFIEAVGRREPVVLGSGTTYTAVQVAANESQFLDTLTRNLATICRFYLVPPEVIGAPGSSSMTYANVESRGIQLLQQAYQPWVTKFEDALTEITTRPLRARVNLDALLRVDTLTRWRIHDMRLRHGSANVNEVRAVENEPPTPDGDEYLWPPYRAFPIADDSGDAPDGPAKPS